MVDWFSSASTHECCCPPSPRAQKSALLPRARVPRYPRCRSLLVMRACRLATSPQWSVQLVTHLPFLTLKTTVVSDWLRFPPGKGHLVVPFFFQCLQQKRNHVNASVSQTPNKRRSTVKIDSVFRSETYAVCVLIHCATKIPSGAHRGRIFASHGLPTSPQAER